MSVVITSVSRKISTWFALKHFIYYVYTLFIWVWFLNVAWCFLPGNRFPGLLPTFLRLIVKITFSLLTINWSRLKNTLFLEGRWLFSIIGHLFSMSGVQIFYVTKNPFFSTFKNHTLSSNFSVETTWNLTCFSLEF